MASFSKRWLRVMSTLVVLALVLQLAGIVPGLRTALAVTITIDGTHEAAWGSPVGTDPQGDMTEINLDLSSLYVVDDGPNYYIGFDAWATSWGMHYGIAIDSDGVDGSGATTNPWGRAVDTVSAHRPEHFINVWHPGNATIESAQLNHWNGSGWSFDNLTAQGGAQAYSEANHWIEYRVPKGALGNPSTIHLELFTTGGDGTHAQDTVPSDPNVNFTSPEWSNTVTTLSAFASYTATVRAHANDNNVEWDGLRHDSRDLLYRTPGGAVPAGTAVTLRMRTFHNDVTSVRLRVYDLNANAQSLYDMAVTASDVSCYQAGLETDTCDIWSATLPNTTPNNFWYRFIVTDGSDTDFYADNTSALDGGLGSTTDDAVDNSYALMVYAPAFNAPSWAKNAVIYQIFPDRFNNGRSDNDPHTGDLRYDDPVLKLPWATLPEGYCRNYSDGNTNCPWRFDPNPPPPTNREQPRGRDYMGGDLKGVDQQLDYLQSVGVNTIYFNPIFDGGSNHGYDTQDYYKIDPYFGTQKDWESLAKHAQQRGMRIIVDGVFNHLSSDSPFFDRYGHYSTVGACESPSSPYRSWFNFRAPNPGEPSPCAPSTPGGNDTYYDGWFGFDSIPVINKSNPAVQQYFLTNPNSVTRYWLQQGASGWRLDVMGDSSFPNGYWETFRGVVKTTDSNALIIGELWQKDSTLLRYLRGDRADTTMNYRLRDAVIGLVAPGNFDSKGFADSGRPLNPSEFAARILSIREDYPDAAYYSLMNLLDSHDTERLLWTLTPGEETRANKEQNPVSVAEGKQRMQLASLVQYTMPGAPTVYYGDEVGMTGDDDPDDRRTFPWLNGSPGGDPNILAHYRALNQRRLAQPSLANGDIKVLLADDAAGTVVYGRKVPTQASLVAINKSNQARTVNIPVAGYLPNGTVLTRSYGVGNAAGGTVTVSGGVLSITLNPLSGLLLATATGVDLQPPAAPANLHVTNEGNGQVTIAWNASAGAASYNVYRSVVSGGGFVKVNTSPVTGTTFTDTGLQNAHTYYYTVSALDAAGNESGPSNQVSGLPHYVIGWSNLQWPPTINHTISTINRTENVYGQVWIDGVTGQPGPTPGLLAQLGFGPDGSDPATNANWMWIDATFNSDAGNNDEFKASMLPEAIGTYDYAYRYSTTAGREWLYADLDGSGNGYSPAQAGSMTVNSSGDTTPPATPANLRVTSAAPGAIALAWDAVVGDPTLYGYELRRGNTPGGPYTTIALVTSGTTYNDTNVTEGSTYYYVVRSLDTSFNRSGHSNEVAGTASPRTVTLVFNVTVPATTDGTGRQVHIAGTLSRLDGGHPDWDPGAVSLTRVDATHWAITFTGLEGTQLEYKYTLGDWDHVEKDAACGEIGNRQLVLSYGSTGTQTVNNTVENWRNVAPCGN